LSYIGHILVALVSLATVDFGWCSEVAYPGILVALTVSPWIVGRVVRRLVMAGRFRIAALGERLLSALPVLLQWWAASGLGWFAFLKEHIGLDLSLETWPGLSLLAGLAPYLVYQLVAIDAESRLSPHSSGSASRSRNLQLRFFATALIPFLVYLSFSSLVGLSETTRVHVEEVSIFSALFTLSLIAFLLWFLPRLIVHAWETVPMEAGWMREMLEGVAKRVNFRYRELLLWRTGRMLSNAAIVGFTRNSRVVLFSDALLTQLRPEELAAVFTHEIGHAKRGHVVSFAAWSLVFLLGANVLVGLLEEPELPLYLGIFATALVAWYLAFGYMSRRFELEADLESRAFFGESGALIRALAAVSGPRGQDHTSWRHFSPMRRMQFLQAVDLDPGIGIRLQKRMRWVARTGWVLCLLVLAAEGNQLVENWTPERLSAELRLGHYAHAALLLEEVRDELDEASIAMVEFAGDLADGLRVDELERRSRTEYQRGNQESTVHLLQLSILRGARELIPVLEWLRSPDGGEDGKEGVSEAELPEAWRTLLLGQ